MPGKHAPTSPRSFYVSLARAIGAFLAGIGLLIAIIIVAVGSGKDEPAATPTVSPTPSASVSPVPTPSETTSPPEATASPSVRTPSQTSVVVLNGTDRAGLAARVAEGLRAANFRVLETGNTPEPASETAIYYRTGGQSEANALLELFPELRRVRAADESTRTDGLLTVVLGNDYEG